MVVFPATDMPATDSLRMAWAVHNSEIAWFNRSITIAWSLDNPSSLAEKWIRVRISAPISIWGL